VFSEDALMSCSVIEIINERIAGRRLLDHPFYQAWSQGDLTRDALKTYAAQYYQWVLAFPTWISAAHANSPDLVMRQALLDNLIDEETGPDNHPELWLRFSDALGLDRDAVRSAQPLPETSRAISTMRGIARETPAVAAVAALYAYESQQPQVMATKRQGLRDRYGVTTGHDYFVTHEAADIEHSAMEQTLIERYSVGHETAVLAAVDAALDATYVILDGVERVRA
jgi:pyrroloquinoline-quinone synthase